RETLIDSRGRAGHFEQHVYPFVVGQIADDADNIFTGRVDHAICAKLTGHVQPITADVGGKDSTRPGSFRHVDRHEPDGTAACDEHKLADTSCAITTWIALPRFSSR